jgi:hypothetical protein
MFLMATHLRVRILILGVGLLIGASWAEQTCLAAAQEKPALAPRLDKGHKNSAIKPLEANNTAEIEKKWGVKLQGIQITAAGHMLDFRFRVTDSFKAAPLVDPKNKPTVVVEENGVTLEVPNVYRIGSLRQTSKQIKEGMMFAILFANPGKMVMAGEKLTVHIGDFSVEHITVGDILNAPPVHKKPHARTSKNG